MSEEDLRRRNSLLATLNFEGGHGVARALRDELESTHGIAVSLDKLRADILWLEDLGALKRQGDLCQITAEGREHAHLLRRLF